LSSQKKVNATEFEKKSQSLKFKKQSGIRNIESISPNCVFAKSRKTVPVFDRYQNFSKLVTGDLN
jgi:hypothetical protein